MMFFVYASILIIVCLGILIIPQIRNKDRGFLSYDPSIQIYKDQLKEIDRDLEIGHLSQEDARVVTTEIERRILGADPRKNENKLKNYSLESGRWALPAFLTFFLFGGAVSLYGSLGFLGQSDIPFTGRYIANANQTKLASTLTEEILRVDPALIINLNEQVKTNPRNIEAWISLGRANALTRNYSQAAEAYEKVVQLSNRDPGFLADWAEIRLLKAKGIFNEEIYSDFLDSFYLDALLPKPWFYLGLAHARQGNFRVAVKFWKSLLAITSRSAPFFDALGQKIMKAAEDGNFDPKSIEISEVAQNILAGRKAVEKPNQGGASSLKELPIVLPALSKEELEGAKRLSADERKAMILSMVSRLERKLAANPKDARGWRRLALVYQVLGEKKKALAAEKRAEAAEATR